MLYRIRNGLVAIPAAVTLNQFTSAPEGSKRDMCSAVAHTADPLFKCNPAVEHSASKRLPATF